MELLFLTKLLPRADIIGGPILIYHRIKNLSSMGHGITLIAPCYTEEDRSDKSLTAYTKRVFCVDSERRRPRDEVERLSRELNRPKFFLTGDGAYSEEIEATFKSVLRERFDAIIAEYSMMGQYLEANRDLIPKGTLSVISVHECYTRAFELRKKKGEEIDRRQMDEIKDYEFRMYKAVDLILTLTKEDRQILIGYEPSLFGKIEVVPHGVDTDFYHPPKKRSLDTKNILFTGNFNHYPNVDAVKNFFEKCWGKIKSKVPDAKFYAIGHNPPPEILRFRDEDVIIEDGGDNENMRNSYWRADVFVAPIELGTGFRGKILEAMATGLPVVATRIAAFGIEDEKEKGVFVTADYETFSQYVVNLLANRETRMKAQQAALRLAKKYDHKNAAAKLEGILKKF